jgi:hypothetical protein
MHDVFPVEYGQETFYRSGSVARPGLNVFPKDAPSVLKGSQDRLLVGTIHDVRYFPQQNGFKVGEEFSFLVGAAV